MTLRFSLGPDYFLFCQNRVIDHLTVYQWWEYQIVAVFCCSMEHRMSRSTSSYYQYTLVLVLLYGGYIANGLMLNCEYEMLWEVHDTTSNFKPEYVYLNQVHRNTSSFFSAAKTSWETIHQYLSSTRCVFASSYIYGMMATCLSRGGGGGGMGHQISFIFILVEQLAWTWA